MGPKPAAQDEEKGKVNKVDASRSDAHDPSAKIWNFSLERTSEHDAGMVDRWKGDMDGILIYTGVFSATVAAFLLESYKYLKPDPTEVSSRLLQQVTQELAGISVGDRFPPPDLEPFRPQRAFIHVNILWFLSLCLGLACGLFATLVQQWLRRYIRLTQLTHDPIMRVRIRTFLHSGIEEFHVDRVVENISILLHAAIFLFFAGLVEFLFAFNDEVADVILVATSVLAALYIFFTLLPVIRRNCPYQTPLTTILWYTGHLLAIASLHLFRCSSRVQKRIKELWRHYCHGVDHHLMGLMRDQAQLDIKALEETVNMCRDDSELESFVDAIPGYLQEHDFYSNTEPSFDVQIRVSHIKSLLGKKSRRRHHLVSLFASCTNDHRRLDEGARRRRAVICSRAIWELSRAYLSLKHRGMTLDLPKPISNSLHRLAKDSDAEIAASALRTLALFKRAILEHPTEVHKEKRNDVNEDIIATLPEFVASMDNTPSLTPSPSYHVVQPDDEPSNERLRTLTEYTLDILGLIPHLGKPSHMDFEETRMTLEELCRELNGKDISHADQQCLFNVLNRASDAHTTLGIGGRHHSEHYYLAIKSSTRDLVSTLHDKFAEPLRQRGY